MFESGRENGMMKELKSENKRCLLCMEEHEVKTVEILETEMVKEKEVQFKAIYEYCERADELLETEALIRLNSKSMRAASLHLK